MKNLTRLSDPFGVIEKLMQSDLGSTSSSALDGDTERSEFDISSVVDLLRNIHEKRQTNLPTTMDSLRSDKVELLESSDVIRVPKDPGSAARSGTAARSEWPAVQQELRLWCLGNSTGGKFVVINEKATPEVFTFECIRPIGVSPESWSAITISLDTDALELSPGKHGIVGIRIVFDHFKPAAAKFAFCIDVRGAAGGLVSKLWIDVTFPT